MSQSSLASHNMVDRYEALRHQVLKGCGTSAGLALFINRGMAAWMHAWKEYAPILIDNMQEKRQHMGAELPANLRGDLVMTLVNMTLNIGRG